MTTQVKSPQTTYPNILRIEGRNNIYLRLINRDDVPELYEVMKNNRKHLEQHLQTGDLSTEGIEKAVDWMIRSIKKGSHLQYRIIVGEKIIGSALLYDIDRKKGTAKAGIWVEKKSEGEGYAGDAMKRLIDYSFDKIRLEKVIFDIDPDNKRSEKLVERLGGNLASNILTEKLESGRDFTYRTWEIVKL
jgi:RimJ/RimL family protein N-acetyltransferase